MNAELWEASLHLPSVRRFFDRIGQDFSEGRSVIVLTPPQIAPEDLWDPIYSQLFRVDYLCEVLDLATVEGVPSDVVGMARLLAPSANVNSLDELHGLLRSSAIPDVVWLKGISLLQEGMAVGWLQLVQQWAEFVRRAAPETRVCRFCLLAPARPLLQNLPRSDVRLSQRWWWGFPSALELRLLCHELGAAGEAATAWRESLVSGVGAGDLCLADTLWSEFPENLGELLELLRAFGKGRLHLDSGFQHLSEARRYGVVKGAELPSALQSDWSEGRIIASVEYGVEVHPAALAVHGDQEQIEHRLWRGQAPLLLPLADQVRLQMCSHLMSTYGRAWYARWFKPRTDEELHRLETSSLDAELGFLVTLARRVYDLRRNSNRVALELAWSVRNQLAHYEPVDWEDFRSFWEQDSGA